VNTFLIINADDFGLTDSVSNAILDCHERGVVSSTSAFANQAMKPAAVRRTKKCEALGVGLHLNVTKGEPVASCQKVRSLITKEGCFKPYGLSMLRNLNSSELLVEWKAQVRRFQKIWGRMPTHLDTHHHIHQNPKVGRVFLKLAKELKLPFRFARKVVNRSVISRFRRWDLLLPARLVGSLKPSEHWTVTTLSQALGSVPPGISEVMCHPGYVTAELKQMSSFVSGRQKETQCLMSPRIINLMIRLKVQLINYGYLKV